MDDTTMQDSSAAPLFDNVTFCIIPTSLEQDRIQQLTEEIENAGGKIMPFDVSKGRMEQIESVAYIVSTTTDFPDYYRALDLMIHIVKPKFIEDCLKVSKVKNPRSYNPDPALFMTDVVAVCGDLPEGDQDAIAGGIIAMGGQYSTGLTKATTHLFALSMDDSRCKLAVDKKLPLKIVLPHWFDDCLKVGRRIHERPYILPEPEILNHDVNTVPTTNTSSNIHGATNPEPTHDPSTPLAHSENPRAIKAFSNKKIKLGDDLNINARLKGTIIDLIEAGGGSMTRDINDADIYICSYRDGQDYVKASQKKIDVGNLSWLYFLITHTEWTNPMRRMLHYPRPRHGIPGFENFKMSISGYTGEARVFLENLIKASGAEFTKTFRQDNTHLIAAHKNSEKCDAASEWDVNIVNHLWIEESYARCKNLALTDTRYTHFPPRTNMGEVLGSTEIDPAAVERMFFPTKPRSSKAAHSKTQPGDVPASSMAAKPGKRTKPGDEVATPVANRQFGGKENETPGTTGSRGAKDRALSKLHESAEDIAKFEKEMKRKGGVTHGGRRPKDDEVEKKSRKERDSTASKRSIDEVDGANDGGTTEEDEVAEPAKKNKKARKEKLVPIQYRMLMSKDERWLGHPDKQSKDQARMRELGVFITDNYKNIDLLVAPKVVRTEKFVAALACGPTLLSTEFLDYALKHGKIPPLEKFPLDVSEYEKEHKIKMADSIVRAKQNKHRLLKNWTIFCSNNVRGGFETFQKIIVANGGVCQAWTNRTTKLTAAKRKIDALPEEVSQNLIEDEGDVLYLISESKKSETSLWKSFRKMAEQHDMIPRIVSTEWLLNVAIAQKMIWKEEWELKEENVK
ncbi:BRCT domain-containing protein [Periconia macrospinosa]|uniref:BRCT domain-containing protein n=1 Tax=Periconia macrospinosa TaxID=97972 RepID=A0A2V1ED54_9PLEO|nr:BRCT domain-containing protein [Periconia macrospinosa]